MQLAADKRRLAEAADHVQTLERQLDEAHEAMRQAKCTIDELRYPVAAFLFMHARRRHCPEPRSFCTKRNRRCASPCLQHVLQQQRAFAGVRQSVQRRSAIAHVLSCS